MTPPVDDVAWLAGGILWATGDLDASLTAREAAERLTSVLVPPGRIVAWAPPEAASVAALEDTLMRAWAEVVGMQGGAGGGWDDDILRLGVWDVDALESLGPVSVAGRRVVAHAELRAYRIAWRWPLRVGVATAAMQDQIGGGGPLVDIRVLEVGQEGPLELVVLDRPGAGEPGTGVPTGVRAACVVLPGTTARELGPELLGRLRELGAAAVLAMPSGDLSWFAAAVGHLACGRPLDVAIGLAAPDAVLLAFDGFLELTAGREYARALLDHLPGDGADDSDEVLSALGRLADLPFDADGRAGAELAALVDSLSTAGLDGLTTVELHLQTASMAPPEMTAPEMAPPEMAPPEMAPPEMAPPGDATTSGATPADDAPAALPPAMPPPEGDAGAGAGGGLEAMPPPPPGMSPPPAGDAGAGAGGGLEAAPAPPALPDARRLQAQVADAATGKVLDDRFVGGAAHEVRVRIAAAAAQGVVVGDAVFVSPAPGRDTDLTVEVVAGATHAKRKLKLPALGDSGWTRPVPFQVPTGAGGFEVFIQVWFAGRVVQSAVLSGAVLDRDAPTPTGKLRLSVDASTPAAAVHRMKPADASITIVPGLTGEPVPLTFDQGEPIEADRLAKANKGVRSVLLDAFRRPPPASLAEAAGTLTRLAVRGRILHDSLRESIESFPGDESRWIHVSAFGSADLPLELVYTHPKPSSDDEVPVCPSALAGVTECAAACPDRDRNDVVCPYGFWATSKVIERRRHVDRRARLQAGSERTIAVLAEGAAGVAVKADEVDTTATRRILEAVKTAVAAGHFRPVSTWKEVGEAAKAPPTIMVLITHTVTGDDDLGPDLQLGTDLMGAHRVGDDGFLNPGDLEPGPVVIAIGCDTADLDTSFTDYVTNLHAGGAELVVSAISPVPGRQVADFVERFFAALPAYLATPGEHRFGEVLTAVRRQTVATGDVLALALTASGDADVALQGS